MRKGLLVMIILILCTSMAYTHDIRLPGRKAHTVKYTGKESTNQNTRPDTVEFSFSIAPVTILMSYYDYMIGGHNSLPLCVDTGSPSGGYILTFHGQRSATGQRRVFNASIEAGGNVHAMSELTNVQNYEGFSSIDIDPVSGTPFYAWHAWLQTFNNPLDVQFTYNSYLNGIPEIEPPQVIVNNPVTMTAPFNTTDNEFIWPTLQIGPSPNFGMQRVYVLCRNLTRHIAGSSMQSGNAWIVYADFNSDMLEANSILTWNHTTIPILDAWNHASDNTFRSFNGAFTVGDDGRIFLTGYHESHIADTESEIIEPELDAFVCDNYGTGTWQRINSSAVYPSWNPHNQYNSSYGIFTQSDDQSPLYDEELSWKIINSEHMNAVMDNSGLIHMGAVFAQHHYENNEGHLRSYYNSTLQNVKDLVYNTNSQIFNLREIYPKAGTSSDSLMWLPWDTDADGIIDAYDLSDTMSQSYGDPLMQTTFPFPYWDDSVHTNSMFFHYNNIKITKPNHQGMIAVVWQDSNRARKYNQFTDIYPELASYSDTPEIYISVSSDNGYNWSAPIILNKVVTPELAGMKPMWVYPADRIIFSHISPEGHLIGKLGLLFYDDISWGSYQMDPPVGQNDGGYVKFAELEIAFPATTAIENPETEPLSNILRQNYPNPFNPETTIGFIMSKSGKCDLKIYNSKGQLIKTLLSNQIRAGEQKIKWDGTDNDGKKVSSGIYAYKISSGTYSATRKMILLK